MLKIKQIAFTLIELLVVIAIVGILSGLIIVGMNGMTQKATIAKAQVFSNSLRNSLMMNTVGEWKLDEGSGTAANDTWTKVNNGVLTNFTNTTAGYGDTNTDGWMSSSNCISGTCLKFDGTDDYVDCGSGSSLNIIASMTIGVWVKLNNDYTSIQAIIGNTVSGSEGTYILDFGRADNKFTFLNGGASSSAVSNVSVSDNNWHYLTIARDGNTGNWNISFYLDGLFSNTVNITTDPQIAGSTSIGRTGSYNGFYFNGSMDDIRIFNSVMSTSQIREQYYAGLNNLIINESIDKEEYFSRVNLLADK